MYSDARTTQNAAPEMPAAANPTMTAASRATRIRSETCLAAPRSLNHILTRVCRSRRGFPQHVADPTHRVDQPGLAAGLGLAPQVADVDLERVTGGREVVAPDLLEDAASGQHPARVGQQQLEQGELGAGQADLPLAAAHLPGLRIQRQVGEGQR